MAHRYPDAALTVVSEPDAAARAAALPAGSRIITIAAPKREEQGAVSTTLTTESGRPALALTGHGEELRSAAQAPMNCWPPAGVQELNVVDKWVSIYSSQVLVERLACIHAENHDADPAAQAEMPVLRGLGAHLGTSATHCARASRCG